MESGVSDTQGHAASGADAIFYRDCQPEVPLHDDIRMQRVELFHLAKSLESEISRLRDALREATEWIEEHREIIQVLRDAGNAIAARPASPAERAKGEG